MKKAIGAFIVFSFVLTHDVVNAVPTTQTQVDVSSRTIEDRCFPLLNSAGNDLGEVCIRTVRTLGGTCLEARHTVQTGTLKQIKLGANRDCSMVRTQLSWVNQKERFWGKRKTGTVTMCDEAVLKAEELMCIVGEVSTAAYRSGRYLRSDLRWKLEFSSTESGSKFELVIPDADDWL
ncbi:hypothetical protein NDN08_004903 [Rhodosorus marinus]|uniref:Uncharacterized protein n=1 Tax=Rhodosorus marinus TaxID=101924 RepID=A0AAV8UF18_9RHOD|nr:hypothetical protein NDN08_004903 [Rhodosorus marinus]